MQKDIQDIEKFNFYMNLGILSYYNTSDTSLSDKMLLS